MRPLTADTANGNFPPNIPSNHILSSRFDWHCFLTDRIYAKLKPFVPTISATVGNIEHLFCRLQEEVRNSTRCTVSFVAQRGHASNNKNMYHDKHHDFSGPKQRLPRL